MTGVTRGMVTAALQNTGIREGDTVVVHSSLKSFGRVQGGPNTVIDGVIEAVRVRGTAVFPALRQNDFQNAYRDWNIRTTPSDVGLVSETFRLRPGVLRSDHPTHSVCAFGARAAELTGEHSAYGPRMGVFGDYCFSWSSPWQKLYLWDCAIVMMGVSLVYNTMKHLVEYIFVDEFLHTISDAEKRCRAMREIATFRAEGEWPQGIWPFHDGRKTQELMEKTGKIRHAVCGESLFTIIRARDYVDTMLNLFRSRKEDWFSEEVCDFIERYSETE